MAVRSNGKAHRRADGGALFAGAGLSAGLAGIVASSCCVLPLVFAGFGIGGATFAVLPVLAAWRPYLLGAAVLALAAAWLVHLRRRRACRADAACAAAARPDRGWPWLAAVSAVVLLAIVWQSLIEPQILLLLR
jgi:mercuric ion transport protein